jgi:hypothetical protein
LVPLNTQQELMFGQLAVTLRIGKRSHNYMGHGWTIRPIETLLVIGIFFQQPLFSGDRGIVQLVEIIKVNYSLYPK